MSPFGKFYCIELWYTFFFLLDPEELVVLLFEKVLQMDPLIEVRTLDNVVNKSLLYQIFPTEVEKDLLPVTVQGLLELSLFESGLLLNNVSSFVCYHCTVNSYSLFRYLVYKNMFVTLRSVR